MRDFIEKIIEKIRNFFPSRTDDTDTRYFKVTLFLILGIFGVMMLIGVIVFFANLKGAETISVPNITTSEVTKIDIIDAILKLQEKYLNVKIQEKSSSKYPRGLVIDQKPRAGSFVKAGRTVTIVVSKGAVINKIEDYRGKTIGWLRYELRSKFDSNEKALLEIKEPVMYQYDPSPAGTILEQSPKPGTSIYENRVTYIDLVVSKGPQGKEFIAENYVGKKYSEVIQLLASQNIPFLFEISNVKSNAREGTVLQQVPEPGNEIMHLVPVKLTISPVTQLKEDEVFNIFEYIVEKYPVAVGLTVISEYEDVKTELFSIKQESGKISFPYIAKYGTNIIIYIMGSEVERFSIQEPVESGGGD